MNIDNYDEMLEYSLKCIDENPILNENPNVKDIVKDSITYGFKQGVIHGMHKGQLQVLEAIQKQVSRENNES